MCKQEENVVLISLGKLHSFPGHPFQVRDDQLMQQLVDSIRNVGVLVPAIVRKTKDGAYQLIGGHRRKHACEILGLDTLPCIIRDLDDNEATIMMVDSNFQRETILPSEKAKAYKMKLECIKRQGARTDLTSDQTGQKLTRKTSRELISENSPDSSTQIQRFIRLNELIPELLQLVDEGKLAITPAVEISYLREEEQKMLQLTMDSEQASPSLSQGQRMRKLSRDRILTDDMILSIMMEQKKPDSWNLTLPMNRMAKYFPENYTPQKMQETIFALLDRWLALQIKNGYRK